MFNLINAARRSRRAVALAVLFCATQALASDLPAPQGEVVLTVTGNIQNKNDGDSATFDREMLEKLGTVTVETTTPWSNGLDRYEGPLARDVLAAVGAEGSRLLATALNDYVAEIPLSDITENDVVLALRVNGVEMTARDKGPVFVLYPFDKNPDLRNEEIYARSVWQLSELRVE
jgi:hypothetical protein